MPPTTLAQASPAAGPAEEAAQRAGVEVRLLHTVGELRQVELLLSGIWASQGPSAGVSVELLRALVHTGNYVAGAWADRDLVGASVGFMSMGTRARPAPEATSRAPSLHSHVSGVSPSAQGTGVGFALKHHQRAWALEQGIGEITWTFDPLLRRNAWFNLVKLGATADAYHADFYGPMVDGINTGDDTDRCLVRWALTEGAQGFGAEPDLDGLRAGGAVPLLAEDGDGQPRRTHLASRPGPSSPPLLCWVPADVVALRRQDPALAREWRLALRATMGEAMAFGFVADGITRDGWYVLSWR